MTAVNNVTELSNSITATDVLMAGISPAFVKNACVPALIYTEELPKGTLTGKLTKRGTLTAAALAESVALAPGSNGELTDTSVSCTIAKCAVVTYLSVEETEFGNITADRVAAEHGSAIARCVDNDALSLATGLSTVQTAVSVLTVDDIMTAQYSIMASEVPDKNVPLKAVLSHRGALNLRNELVKSGASVWTNQTFLSILGGLPQNNCYIGSMLGIDFYQTSGQATSGSNTAQMLFHPMWTFAGFFAPAPKTWGKDKGSEGFFTEYATYYFYDVLEWNDLGGVEILSAT